MRSLILITIGSFCIQLSLSGQSRSSDAMEFTARKSATVPGNDHSHGNTGTLEGVKSHPGHYVAVGPHFDISGLNCLDEPALTGVNKRFNWRDLEPAKDVYDLSSIEKDLEFLAQLNKHLVVFLIDRSFWTRGALPDYLSAYELKAGGGGFTNLRWYPEVLERYVKLGEEIGKRFDMHPAYEGIALQESSLDLAEGDYEKYDYTRQKYSDALLFVMTHIQEAMPHSHVFWYGNFIPGDWDGTIIRDILNKIAPLGICYGGPDILPFHRGYRRRSYPLYEEYKDRLTLFCSAQDDSYKTHKNDFSHEVEEPVPEEGYLSMEKVFLFARDTLHTRYIFWNYYYEISGEGQHTFDDAMEVIRKYPVFNAPGDSSHE